MHLPRWEMKTGSACDASSPLDDKQMALACDASSRLDDKRGIYFTGAYYPPVALARQLGALTNSDFPPAVLERRFGALTDSDYYLLGCRFGKGTGLRSHHAGWVHMAWCASLRSHPAGWVPMAWYRQLPVPREYVWISIYTGANSTLRRLPAARIGCWTSVHGGVPKHLFGCRGL